MTRGLVIDSPEAAHLEAKVCILQLKQQPLNTSAQLLWSVCVSASVWLRG